MKELYPLFIYLFISVYSHGEIGWFLKAWFGIHWVFFYMVLEQRDFFLGQIDLSMLGFFPPEW